MRLLLVSHGPLAAEAGAAQLALMLAASLRDRGHDATAWSPEPLPEARWYDLWLRQRHKLEAHLEEVAAAGRPYDVIDLPAVTISRRIGRAGRIVARSVQPELRYLAIGLRGQLRRGSPHRLRAPAHALLGAALAWAVLWGWSRAERIVTLGTGEREWMARHVPWTRSKLASYVVAPPAEDRRRLAQVRTARTARTAAGRGTPEGGIRFLWLGRWVEQKGIGRLRRWIEERAAAVPADRFTVAGCGPDAARDLSGLIEAGRVEVVSSFSRDELPALLARHDAGLFTSPVEGWGLSLNEMLEAGLPVFATDAGAVRDLRPHFPDSLRPFPPPAALRAGDLPVVTVSDAYLEEFNWARIAEEYERAVLARPETAPGATAEETHRG